MIRARDLALDIEGVAGVVTSPQGQPGNPEYKHARRLMTKEVNAAITGAFDGKATAIPVNDSRGPTVNLISEDLNPRGECIIADACGTGRG